MSGLISSRRAAAARCRRRQPPDNAPSAFWSSRGAKACCRLSEADNTSWNRTGGSRHRHRAAAAPQLFFVRLGSQLASHVHFGNRPVSTARRAQPAAPMNPALPPREAYSMLILSASVANVRDRNSCWTRFRNSRPT